MHKSMGHTYDAMASEMHKSMGHTYDAMASEITYTDPKFGIWDKGMISRTRKPKNINIFRK